MKNKEKKFTFKNPGAVQWDTFSAGYFITKFRPVAFCDQKKSICFIGGELFETFNQALNKAKELCK